MTKVTVPFFRPDIREEEIDEVVATLRSGWITSGAKVKRFEQEFAKAVGAPYAVALNSCTAALHLAVEALGLKAGQGVLVPTMTFAATAEVVRYLGAVPILVDCDPVTGNMDLRDCALRIAGAKGEEQKAKGEGQGALCEGQGTQSEGQGANGQEKRTHPEETRIEAGDLRTDLEEQGTNGEDLRISSEKLKRHPEDQRKQDEEPRVHSEERSPHPEGLKRHSEVLGPHPEEQRTHSEALRTQPKAESPNGAASLSCSSPIAPGSGRYADGPEIVGIMPVHVGGLMMDMKALSEFAQAHNLWIVEDAAHAFPAAVRRQKSAVGDQQSELRTRRRDGENAEVAQKSVVDTNEWRKCGQMEEGERRVVCFSFYANKTITTGEGGMAVTGNAELADRMRLMSLHGLSQDAWERYSGGSSWDYKIIAPGYKYNLTDIAAAIGIHQLDRAEEMRKERESIARFYLDAFKEVAEIELPPEDVNRIHAWHLFPIRLCLERLRVDRNQFVEKLKQQGVGCSVHWRPLHLHPYYQETFGYRAEDFPVATALWQRLISLPIFPGMRAEELEHVVRTVSEICRDSRSTRPVPAGLNVYSQQAR